MVEPDALREAEVPLREDEVPLREGDSLAEDDLARIDAPPPEREPLRVPGCDLPFVEERFDDPRSDFDEPRSGLA